MKKSEVCRVMSGGPVIRINVSISALLAGFIGSAAAGVTSKQTIMAHAFSIFIINMPPCGIAGLYPGEAIGPTSREHALRWSG